jgi:hypothetical protein
MIIKSRPNFSHSIAERSKPMISDHHHDSTGDLPFVEKLVKLLAHWIKHNQDHASNYRNWAEKAKENGKNEVAALLEDAENMSLVMNGKFKRAVTILLGK